MARPTIPARIGWLIACLLGCSMFAAVARAEQPGRNWSEVLGPAQGAVPAPRAKVIWQGDLAQAMTEAKAENRPLFVTFRCLPCKQCSAFDKDVLEGGPDLDPLLKQFVTVRLTSAKEMDFRVFPVTQWQDMDLSWWGYFLSPDARIYGIFGGRDEVSDETRISKAALVRTLTRVLAHHYDPRRAAWDIDGPAPDVAGAPQLPTALPGYASWADGRKLDKRTAEANCLHCHQVSEILRQPAIDGKTFDKHKDLDIWPLPENVGLKLDRDDGLRVTAVTADSPAAKAGLKPGDALGEAGGRRLFGQADFRGALHRGPSGAGSIELAWVRDGQVMAGKLDVAAGWRKTVLDWRTSVAGGNIGGPPGFFPVPASAGDRAKFGIPDDAMAVHPFGVTPEAKAAGLTQQAMVTAVGDVTRNLAGRPFLVWFRMNHEPGDAVTITVKDNPTASPRQITYKTPTKPG